MAILLSPSHTFFLLVFLLILSISLTHASPRQTRIKRRRFRRCPCRCRPGPRANAIATWECSLPRFSSRCAVDTCFTRARRRRRYRTPKPGTFCCDPAASPSPTASPSPIASPSPTASSSPNCVPASTSASNRVCATFDTLQNQELFIRLNFLSASGSTIDFDFAAQFLGAEAGACGVSGDQQFLTFSGDNFFTGVQEEFFVIRVGDALADGAWQNAACISLSGLFFTRPDDSVLELTVTVRDTGGGNDQLLDSLTMEVQDFIRSSGPCDLPFAVLEVDEQGPQICVSPLV